MSLVYEKGDLAEIQHQLVRLNDVQRLQFISTSLGFLSVYKSLGEVNSNLQALDSSLRAITQSLSSIGTQLTSLNHSLADISYSLAHPLEVQIREQSQLALVAFERSLTEEGLTQKIAMKDARDLLDHVISNPVARNSLPICEAYAWLSWKTKHDLELAVEFYSRAITIALNLNNGHKPKLEIDEVSGMYREWHVSPGDPIGSGRVPSDHTLISPHYLQALFHSLLYCCIGSTELSECIHFFKLYEEKLGSEVALTETGLGEYLILKAKIYFAGGETAKGKSILCAAASLSPLAVTKAKNCYNECLGMPPTNNQYSFDGSDLQRTRNIINSRSAFATNLAYSERVRTTVKREHPGIWLYWQRDPVQRPPKFDFQSIDELQEKYCAWIENCGVHKLDRTAYTDFSNVLNQAIRYNDCLDMASEQNFDNNQFNKMFIEEHQRGLSIDYRGYLFLRGAGNPQITPLLYSRKHREEFYQRWRIQFKHALGPKICFGPGKKEGIFTRILDDPQEAYKLGEAYYDRIENELRPKSDDFFREWFISNRGLFDHVLKPGPEVVLGPRRWLSAI